MPARRDSREPDAVGVRVDLYPEQTALLDVRPDSRGHLHCFSMESDRGCGEQAPGAEAWVVDAFPRTGIQEINHRLDYRLGRRVLSSSLVLLSGLFHKGSKGVPCLLPAGDGSRIESLDPPDERLDHRRRFAEEVLNDSFEGWPLEKLAGTARERVMKRGQDLFLEDLHQPLSAKVTPRRPALGPRQRRQAVVTVRGVHGTLPGFQAVSRTKQEQGGCKGSDGRLKREVAGLRAAHFPEASP